LVRHDLKKQIKRRAVESIQTHSCIVVKVT